MTSRRTSFLVTLVMFLASSVAFAQKDTPGTAAVRAANDSIVKLLKAKAPAAKVTKAVRTFLDIDKLGQEAMANQWSSLKKKQQKQFLALLHKLIEANYVKGMNAQINYTTTYVSDTLNANGTRTVVTQVTWSHKGHPQTHEIDYTLSQNKKKAWMAYDITTDQVSTVENYKAMFDKVSANGGFDNLMDKMQKKLDSMNAANTAASTGGTASTTASTDTDTSTQ